MSVNLDEPVTIVKREYLWLQFLSGKRRCTGHTLDGEPCRRVISLCDAGPSEWFEPGRDDRCHQHRPPVIVRGKAVP